jgi:hypothetical protein
MLPELSNASLKLYDLLGRETLSLSEGTLIPGGHSFPIDVSGLPSGSYYCVLSVEGGPLIAKPVEILK